MKIYLLFLSLIFLIVLGGCTIYSENIPFETIAKVDHLEFGEKGDYVIKTQQEWGALWEKMYYQIPEQIKTRLNDSQIEEVYNQRKEYYPLPEINFEEEMVIAVFLGSKSSGGYDIEITKILASENSLKVIVKEESPGQGIVTLAVTQPCHIVKLKKTDREIVFQRK